MRKTQRHKLGEMPIFTGFASNVNNVNKVDNQIA